MLSPVPPTGGAASFQPATIDSVDAIYDGAQQGRDMVLWMMPKPDQPSGLLVQFYDSKRVFDLDFSTDPTTITTVASTSTVPALNTSFTFCWSRDHRTRGYVYVFRDEDTPNSTLVFIDQDRDHHVDSVISVTDAAWVTGDWSVLSSYY
jgi:hypothetical protein